MSRYAARLIAAFIVVAGLSFAPAAAAMTLGDYLVLRSAAAQGDRTAERRRRDYVIGLTDGIQAVQAPARVIGARLHFCMDDKFPFSPAVLDQLIEQAIGDLTRRGLVEKRRGQPMAVLVAMELERRFPCH